MPGTVRQPPPRHKFRPPPLSTSFILPSARRSSTGSTPVTSQQMQSTDDDDDEVAFSMPNNFVTCTSNCPSKSGHRRLSLIPASSQDSDSDTENPHPNLSSHRDLPVRIPGFTSHSANVDTVINATPSSAGLDMSDLPLFPTSSDHNTGVDTDAALRRSHTHLHSSVPSDKLQSRSLPGVWESVRTRRARRERRRQSQAVPRQSHVEGIAETKTAFEEERREIKKRKARRTDSTEAAEDAEREEEEHEDDEEGDADGEGEDHHEDKEAGNATEGDAESDDEPYVEKIRRQRDARMSPSQLWCFYFFEEPKSRAAKLFAIVSSFFIFVSVVMVCIESLPQFQDPSWDNIWLPIECIVNGVFTIEYLGRFYASTRKVRFVVDFMNLVDLISVLPFYISFIFPSQAQYAFRFIRILRLFRVVKIFRFSKYSVGLRIASRVFRSSVDQLIMVSTYILVIVLLSSALMYYIERGDWDNNTHQWKRYNPNTGELEVSPFQSIAHGFYWSIVTLTTTGYGDEVPYTTWGQAVAAFTMLCGILAIALPTSIIGSNFMNEWQEHRRLQYQARLRKYRKRVAAEEGVPEPRILLSGPEGKLLRERHLRERNQQMLEVMVEVQDKLAEINPPRYYRKYTNTKAELRDALARIGQLELECTRLRKLNANLTKFNTVFKKSTVDSGISQRPGGADDDLYVTDSNTTDIDLLSANPGLTLTGRAREKLLNTLFRRTNGGGSGFATPGSPLPGANNSTNESASNSLTSAFMRTFTEPVSSGWRGGSGHITPEVEGEGEVGDRPQPTRRFGLGTHRRGWSSNNASVTTFQSVEERDALPSRSGATSPFGSPPPTPWLTQYVTASLRRMSTPAWKRTSTQGSGASGSWFRMEEADGRRKPKGKRQSRPIKKEMIGKPTDLRIAYAPHPEVVSESTRRNSAEEENPLSMRTVPATNREMESVLGDRYGLWLAERAKMAATSAGGRVQQGGRKAVADKGESVTAEGGFGSTEKGRPLAFKRAGESLLSLFEPAGSGAGDCQKVQSQEMIEVVVHPLNEEIQRNEDGTLCDGERSNDSVNMTDYFSLSAYPSQSSSVLLHDSHTTNSRFAPSQEGRLHDNLQRWDQSQGLLLSEDGHHRESNDGEGGTHEQHGGRTGGDLGTMWLGVGSELEVRREDDEMSPQ